MTPNHSQIALFTLLTSVTVNESEIINLNTVQLVLCHACLMLPYNTYQLQRRFYTNLTLITQL
jgi:hypothetical protein